MNIQEKESLYLQAKEAYYIGEPIMSDFEFDTLESELKDSGSSIIHKVGSTKAGKFDHISPMLSLGKISVYDNEQLPLSEVSKWMSDSNEFEVTPKLDGNAVNLIYEKGKLKLALSRGTGLKGFDITEKLKHIVPALATIPYEGIPYELMEIRGEVVLPVSIFNKKYSDFKNPRNFVAGVLGRDETDPNVVKDFKFVAFELKGYHSTVQGLYEYPQHSTDILGDIGFETPYRKSIQNAKEFKETYFEFLNYRENISPYQLDGMVLKMKESDRKDIGYTDHHPKWAIAIKFPPKEAVTTIIDISWKTGTSGEIIPTAVMEPIDLDGSTVSRASLFNWGKVNEMKTFPGAKVLIAKAGDIIPQVYQVVEPSEYQTPPPSHCPSCGTQTRIDGIHIWCDNQECFSRVISKIEGAIRTFKIENVGSSTIRKIYEAGFKSILDIFNFEKFNEEALIKTGLFKEGRALEIIMENVKGVKSVSISQALMACQFENLGWATAQELGKFLSGIDHDFKGLNREVVNSITDEDSDRRKFLMDLINILNNSGILVTYDEPKVKDNNIIYFEMTGSPGASGFKVKAEFIKYLSDKGYEHHKLNSECKYLVTDSYTSSSSKMKAAEKLGVEIITYEDLINKIK
jgi:DNA ligase (NAD+)